MTKLNKITCWLLLFAMILSACSVLSMGNTHANYKNNVFWNTVVKAGQPISSDCLVPGGQIILLGEVTEETEITISFAARSEMTGTLSCELVDPEQSVYLTAFLTGDEIHLTRGTQSVGLHLMPSEEALKLETPVNVDVFVRFVAGEQVLEGTFRVTLLSKEASQAGKDSVYKIEGDTEIVGGAKDPVYDVEGDTEIVGGAKDPVYDIEGDTEIVGGAKDPVYDIEGDTEIVGGAKDPVYDVEDDTEIFSGAIDSGDRFGIEPSENEDPVYNIEADVALFSRAIGGDGNAGNGSSGDDDPIYDLGNDTEIVGGATGGGGNAEENGPEDDDPVYDLENDTEIVGGATGGGGNAEVNGSESKDPVYKLENDTDIIGGAAGKKPEEEQFEVREMMLETLMAYSKADMIPVSVELPEGSTRLKLTLLDPEQGGETWLPAFSRYSADGGRTWYMLYYGGAAIIEEDDLYTLRAADNILLLDFSGVSGYLGEVLQIQTTTYAEGIQYIGQAEIYSMDIFSATSSYDTVDEVPILTAEQPLSLTERGADGLRRHTLEKLVQLADGTTAYSPVTDDSIYVRFENGSVVLLVGDTLPDAGTYRLSVEYSFKGVCFAASQHTFFVNYSGHAHAVNWG